MNSFSKREIIKFLRTIDSLLSGSFVVEIIGGAAAAIAFRSKENTVDIDTTESMAQIEGLMEPAKVLSGIDIPMGCGGVWDGPYHYRRRRKRAKIRGLKRLKVYTPDVYDWALMKVMRFRDRDIKHIMEAHQKIGFKKNTLLRRFLSEMSHVIGNPSEIVYNFLLMVKMLFGTKEAQRVLGVIKRHKNWKDSLPANFNPYLGELVP